MDRLVMASKPLKYNILMTRRRMQYMIIFSWVVAISFGIATSVTDRHISKRIEIMFTSIAAVYVLVTAYTYARIVQQIKRYHLLYHLLMV